MTKIWWVNQKQKINGRLANEIIWSPLYSLPHKNKPWHWESMWDASIGDIVLHYSSEAQAIVAVSRVVTEAAIADNPFEDKRYTDSGKLLQVELKSLTDSIPKCEIPIDVRRASSEHPYPFQKSGERLKQGYFFEAPEMLWDAIVGIRPCLERWLGQQS